MLLVFAALVLCHSAPVWLDTTKSIKERVRALIDNMTLEEKLGQMQQIDGRDNLPPIFEHQHPGSILCVLGADTFIPIKLALQQRLQIPIVLGVDAIHGHGFWPGATVFPTALAVAQSWDEEVIEMQGNVTAYEMRYTGVSWTFSPVLCIARDLRWGRVGETFGEDPFLIGRFAAALIRGLQGPNGLTNDPDKVMACAKHFASYSETEGGRDSSEADNSRRKVKSWLFPPFHDYVKAKGAVAMTSYQATDGLPTVTNRWFIRDVLRDEWNFTGFIVTDWYCVGWLVEDQQVAVDMTEASAKAVNAGNDMMMATPFGFFSYSQELL